MTASSGSTLRAVLLASSFAFIVVQLDVTIVNVALPAVGKELGADVGALQWVVDAYTLGFAVFLLTAGLMGDRFGPRRIFLAGFALFAAASVACALAPSVLALDVARVAQGIGAALLVPSSLSILNSAYAHDKVGLAKAIGWWTAAGGVSIAAGPVVGALLLSIGGWRSIFWVNVPICLAGFVLACKAVPRVHAASAARSFDLPGQLLAMVALTALVGAVIEAPARGWSSAIVLAALGCAVLAASAFVVVERRSRTPMLPLRLFGNAGFSAAVMFGVLVNFSYYGVIFILSIYLQRVRGFSATETGLAFLPLTGTFIFSNIASGWLTSRAGLRMPMVLGALLGAAGYALLGSLGSARDASFLQMLPGLALIPAGMGLAVPAMTTSILGSVQAHQAGVASAVLNTARQVGGAMGVAVFGAMVAAGSPDQAERGLQLAMAVSSALLLAAGALAYRYIARSSPAPASATSLCR
ncbi:MFS transporter [Massilia sp. RP-1-19]|uniref:MFS transporter n=1 Tax=Massilia polaris TaxID=2728846 RepID=A0A848HF35_9BURK|nr:MFS transporter [Massilia polaris]NML59854.1 MFS transporter [Massilia polaris]